MGNILDTIRILEFGEGVTAPGCAKYMADLGAEVIKIEPLKGDRARRTGPFYKDKPDLEGSALFLYLNTNKLGVTLDPSKPTGKEIFLKLVKESDALIENYPPGFLESHGLGYETLKAVNPLLVMTSITPFGQTGPHRDYKGSDLIAFHAGGVGMETPEEVTDPLNQPPLRGGSYQGHFLTAVTAAIATMAMLFGRHNTGLGAHLDISEYEAVADNMRTRISQFCADGVLPSRLSEDSQKPGRFGAAGLQPCKDGYVQFHIVEKHMWASFAEIIGRPEWANDERFTERPPRSANWHIVEPVLREYTMQHTKADIARACQSRRVPCAPVNAPEDLLDSDHLRQRGFFIEVEHALTGKVRYPGLPANLNGAAAGSQSPAPLLGQHNEGIFVRRLGFSKEQMLKLYEAGII